VCGFVSSGQHTKLTINVRIPRQKIGWIIYAGLIVAILTVGSYFAASLLLAPGQPASASALPIQYVVTLYVIAVLMIGLGLAKARGPSQITGKPRPIFLTQRYDDTDEAVWVVDYAVPTQNASQRVAFYKAVHKLQREIYGKDAKFRSHSCFFLGDLERARKFLKIVQAFGKDCKLYRATEAS
jgi:hypothetical protein